jgi:hypothetical protein
MYVSHILSHLPLLSYLSPTQAIRTFLESTAPSLDRVNLVAQLKTQLSELEFCVHR